MKTLFGILIGISFNRWINLGKTDILTMLSLSIHEHCIIDTLYHCIIWVFFDLFHEYFVIFRSQILYVFC